MPADAVSLKLPSLWTNYLETWFAQAEAQFALRDITNETTKFHHVVFVLSADVASKVSSILRSPPGHNPDTALKKQLTCKYQLTEHERGAAIFNIPALGDERPSQIMDRMLHLLGGCEGGILFRYHFISILPIYVKNTLALSTTTDLQQLALEADRIFMSGQLDNSTVILPPMTELQRYPEYNATTANTTLLVPCISSTRGSEAELRSVSNHVIPCDWSLNYRQGQQ